MLFMGLMSLGGPEDYGRLSDEELLKKKLRLGTGSLSAAISEYGPDDIQLYPVYCKAPPGCGGDHAGGIS